MAVFIQKCQVLLAFEIQNADRIERRPDDMTEVFFNHPFRRFPVLNILLNY